MATRAQVIPVAQRNQPITSSSVVLTAPETFTLEITGDDFATDDTTAVTLLVERFVGAVWVFYSRGTFPGGPPPTRDGVPMAPGGVTATYPAGTYRATLTPNKRFRFGIDRIVP